MSGVHEHPYLHKILTTFFSSSLSHIISLYSSLKSPTSEQSYNHLLDTSKLIIQISNRITAKKNTVIYPNFQHFLAVMSDITLHPFIEISYMGLEFWGSIIKHEFLSREDLVSQTFNDLLEFIYTRISTLDTKSTSHTTNQTYITWSEFSKEEYRELKVQYRAKMIDIIKNITKLNSIATFSWIFPKMFTFYNTPTNTNTGTMTMTVNLDILTTLFSTVVGNLKLSDQETQGINSSLFELLSKVISLETNDLAIMRCQLDAILALKSVLCMDYNVFLTCLQKVPLCPHNTTRSSKSHHYPYHLQERNKIYLPCGIKLLRHSQNYVLSFQMPLFKFIPI
jgi:hypothetical protein